MKTKAGYFRSFLALSALMFLAGQAPGQSQADSLAQDDQDIMASIATHPAEVRLAILDVAQYPQELVKLERVQARSSQSFQDLIAGYPREQQEKFYEASRFPDMMDQMVHLGKRNPAAVKNLLRDLPAQTQDRLLNVYTNHFGVLEKMNYLYQSSQQELTKIISGYPQSVQNHFQKVISMPEVMSLLTDNIDQTVSLGLDYKANPGEVTQELETLHNKLASQKELDLEAYKLEVANNPELQSEMRSAANDFASSNGQQATPTYVTNNYYDNYSYPYWFSYPYWYSSPIWYPRSFYYHTGFYYGAGGGIVVFGLPSPFYSSWFFGFGYRNYPYLYQRYNNYCYSNRHSILYGRGNGGYHNNAGYYGSRYRNNGNNYGRIHNGNYSGSRTSSVRPHDGSRMSGVNGNRNHTMNRSSLSSGNYRTPVSRYHAQEIRGNRVTANSNRSMAFNQQNYHSSNFSNRSTGSQFHAGTNMRSSGTPHFNSGTNMRSSGTSHFSGGSRGGTMGGGGSHSFSGGGRSGGGGGGHMSGGGHGGGGHRGH